MNEALFVLRVLLDFGAVYAASYLGRAWLYASIIVNLLLVSVLGSKLQIVFGFETNIGNIPYAAVFFATYLLLMRGTIQDGVRAIWLGAGGVAFFTLMTQLTLPTLSAPGTHALSDSMQVVLGFVPRIALASMLGYLAAQHINVWLYTSWSEQVGSMHWWLKMASIVAAAQLVDSVIFFSVGFFGAFTSDEVFGIMMTGFLLKVALGFLSIPLLYLRVRDTVPAA